MINSNKKIICCEFESEIKKNIQKHIYENSLLYFTMVPIFASPARRKEFVPRKHCMESLKVAKLIFVLMYALTSKFEPSFLSLLLEDIRMAFDEVRPALLVHGKTE